MTDPIVLMLGDCLERMRELPDESIDAVVTDPPYGLEFMGKEWDRLGATAEAASDSPGWRAGHGGLGAPSKNNGVPFGGGGNRIRYGGSAKTMQAWHEAWAREAFRVAKPGAHLLAFGGTRTYHRLASAIEDAGWEIRDCLVWAYASGFPKSLNPGKANDTAECQRAGTHTREKDHQCPKVSPPLLYTLGTSMKPSFEPIVMARKPLRGTVAANVQRYGTGAINVDATRIGYENTPDPATNPKYRAENGYRNERGPDASMFQGASVREMAPNPLGRWPANVILTDPIFDGDVDGVVGGGAAGGGFGVRGDGPLDGRSSFALSGQGQEVGYGDTGTYSRFFLIPKASRSDREPLLGGLPLRKEVMSPGGAMGANGDPKNPNHPRANVHPTVKPLELMRHLVRLVTPPGGLVLDPFLGSGTTAIACQEEGFRCIGIEKEPEYMAIAEARLNGRQVGLGLDVDAPRRKAPKTQPKRRAASDNYTGGWAGTEEVA